MRAPFRFALAERLLGAIVGRRQMVDTGKQRAEEFAVGDDAADRDAAEADAVIAALAADQARARAFAVDVVIGDRNLERGVDRLRSGIAKENMIEVFRCERTDPARQLERLRMRELKGRRVVEFGRLRADRRDDRIAIVTGVGAPEPGGAVEHGAAVGRVIVHVLGAGYEPRGSLERAIGRERQPVGLQIVRDRCRRSRSGSYGTVSFALLAGPLPLVEPAATTARLSIYQDDVARSWPTRPTS